MNENYDFCVVITTFNRPDMLLELLNNIEKEKKEYKVIVLVCNDGGEQMADLTKYNVNKIEMSHNMGKRKYYVVINATFSYIKNINSKYYIYLPDDVKLVNDFFGETKRIYELINDPKKICLNILTDDRVNRTNWTDFKSKDHGLYYQTQWNDLCFISEKNFFNVLDYRIQPIDKNRWDQNPNLSSGVGQQISIKLHQKGYNMYHTKNSMVFHGNHESKMNKIERKRINLITK